MPQKHDAMEVMGLRKSTTKDEPSMPMWLKVLLLGGAICAILVGVRRELATNPRYNYTAEQFAHAEQMRTHIRSGAHLEGAIVELRDGRIGFVSWINSDRSKVRVLFPRGEETLIDMRTRDEAPMYSILSITRASDANYPSMREKVLPVRKLPL